MSYYRKTMANAYKEMYLLNEDNMDLMRKAAKGAMQTIKFKDGKLKMDSFTASGIMGVYDKVNTKNKAGIEKIVNSGTKAQMLKLQSLAMKASGGASAGWKLPTKEEVAIAEANVAKFSDDVLKSRLKQQRDLLKTRGDSPATQSEIKRLEKEMKKRGLKEEVEIDEGKMKDIINYDKKGMSVREIAKKLGMIEYEVKALLSQPKQIQKAILSLEEVELDEYNEKSVDKEIEKSGIKKGSKEAKLIHRLLKGRRGSKKEEVEVDEKKKEPVFKGTPTQIKKQMKDWKKKHDKVKIGEEELDEGGAAAMQGAVYASRQLKDRKKEMMVKPPGREEGVIVIDKKDWAKYKKKGYIQVEETKPSFKEFFETFKEVELNEKPADFIRLSFNSPADVKKAKKWMDQNLPGANQGFTGMDASGKDIEFEGVDDAEDLMAKLKKAGFRFKMDHREETELDEAKNYEIKNGKIHISKANFRKVHKDYKNSTKGKERMMALDPKSGATTSFEVVFEEVELDEAKYEIYHKDFSSAMQHAYKAAKKMYGITINPKEIDDKVATGPKKPSSGKTNKYRLKGDKGNVQIQVANLDNKKYELNMYKEEVELGEGKISDKLISIGDDLAKLVKKGGMDKRTYQAAQDYIESGDFKGISRFAMRQDTEPRDNIIDIVAKHLGKKQAMKIFPVKFFENTIEAYEFGTDEYRKYLEDLTPMEGARSDAMKDMKRAGWLKSKDLDKDDTATDDDRKAASKNILVQLKKTFDTEGKSDIVFLDKKKKKVPLDVAKAVLKKYVTFRRSDEKLKFQNKVAKSYKDMLQAIKENAIYDTEDLTILDRVEFKIKEMKDG